MANSSIADNLKHIHSGIQAACKKVGRDPESVSLIAVSKTQSANKVVRAVAAGQRDFGENTIQDAQAKLNKFKQDDLVWHFIGHLQTNKARFIPGQFQWLHSLDDLRLAQKLEQQLIKAKEKLNLLVQVNVSSDPNKSGIKPAELETFIESYLELCPKQIYLRGLMTIGPQTENKNRVGECFARLHKLRQEIKEKYDLQDFDQLSMGMSGDFELAIKEGATMVRIGSDIFGKRQKISSA